MILAEYTEFTGNFNSIASQCLQKLPASSNRLCVLINLCSVDSAGRQIPIAFLERIKASLTRNMEEAKLQLQSKCTIVPIIEEISKLAKVKAQVSEVKGVMMENIEKVLDRGEKIELLVDKTENLDRVSLKFLDAFINAQDFRTQGTKMKRKMWVQNMKIKLIVLGIIIALALMIFCPSAMASSVDTIYMPYIGVSRVVDRLPHFDVPLCSLSF
ncbi:hypothetical protein DH2020_005183 [Rehmannia glutinosa]|uniref:V-SNARE coiled-coil homology domain-containing protein n=1 Tax=Rehmannia glutinosa TaxID=99300 RepID=A0ABR0XRH5_REHGL